MRYEGWEWVETVSWRIEVGMFPGDDWAHSKSEWFMSMLVWILSLNIAASTSHEEDGGGKTRGKHWTNDQCHRFLMIYWAIQLLPHPCSCLRPALGYLEVNETVRPKIIEAYQYKRGADVGRSSIRCWAVVFCCSLMFFLMFGCLDVWIFSLHFILGCLMPLEWCIKWPQPMTNMFGTFLKPPRL